MTALDPEPGVQVFSGGGNTSPDSLPARLLRETEAMARYALASGIGITPAIVQAVEQAKLGGDDGSIAAVHGQLSKLVAPAKPGTIVLFEDEAPTNNLQRVLGPVRLIRQLMTVAVAFLVLFVAMVSLNPPIRPNGDSKSATVTAGGVPTTISAGPTTIGAAAPAEVPVPSKDWSTPLAIVYLCSAAGLGAAFAALSRVNAFISDGTYDRVYDATYWILLVLGLIAGLILAIVIPIDQAGTKQFSKPLLALLGGFSAGAVHRILTRIVSAIETLVAGDDRSTARARDREQDAQVQTERTTVAARLVGVEHALASDPDQARSQLRELVDHLVPTGAASAPSGGNGAQVVAPAPAA